MNPHLKPYNGELSAAEIADGIAAAQANALRLIEDAWTLEREARFPSALALVILAIEERGKVTILKRLALVSGSVALRKAWKEYRSHRAKNAGWIVPHLALQGARTMQAFAPAVDSAAEHAAMLDALKQVSLYTDCLADGHWSVPDAVVSGDLARSFIKVAELMWGGEPITVREIELWREIVGPHWETQGMGDAIIRYQARLYEEGLSDKPAEGLRAFLEGRPFVAAGGS